MQSELDGTDHKILQMLKQEGRLSYSEIGKAVGLSRTAVKNRVNRMEEEGFILGYRAVIRPGGVKKIPFLVNVEISAERFSCAKEELAGAKETKLVLQTTGNCHLVLLCSAVDMAGIRAFVNRVYNQIEGITAINAHAVLDVVKGEIEV